MLPTIINEYWDLVTCCHCHDCPETAKVADAPQNHDVQDLRKASTCAYVVVLVGGLEVL